MEWNENVESEAGEPGISEMSQAICSVRVGGRQYLKVTLHTVATYAFHSLSVCPYLLDPYFLDPYLPNPHHPDPSLISLPLVSSLHEPCTACLPP